MIIDKGFLISSHLGIFSDAEAQNNFFTYAFSRYFGNTLRSDFDKYLDCTFRFEDLDTNRFYVQNGFINFKDFHDYIKVKMTDGINYHNIILTLSLEIDSKIPEPTIYSKNSMLGQLAGRRAYRTCKYVESPYSDSSWDSTNYLKALSQIWNEAFAPADTMTETFLLNNPNIKKVFWLRNNDRMGISKNITVIDPYFQNHSRNLFNETDSNISSNILSMSDTTVVDNDGQSLVLGSHGATPRYYIIEKGANIIHSGDWGTRFANTAHEIADIDYSVISVNAIENIVNGKTYQGLFINAVGVDTVYLDWINTDKYRAVAIKKFSNGNMTINPIKMSREGYGQRLGRLATSQWAMLDRNNNSENNFNSQADEGIFFAYQDKITKKISNLSSSKLVQVNDSRFRVPFFKLVS